MVTQRPRGPLARLRNLITGWFTGWVRDRESRSPRAVYEQAIQGRLERYAELKEAVAGILYLRNKLEGELYERRREMARLRADARRAAGRGDDDLALALVTHRQQLQEEVARNERDLHALRGEAETAKENLLRFRDEIRVLQREKGRALAVLAGAQARRQVRAVLEGLSVEADVRALEDVREHIARLATEAQLDIELGRDEDLRKRLDEIRSEARSEAARRELEEIKRELRPALDAGNGAASPAEAMTLETAIG
jgi:phage shock protein A